MPPSTHDRRCLFDFKRFERNPNATRAVIYNGTVYLAGMVADDALFAEGE